MILVPVAFAEDAAPPEAVPAASSADDALLAALLALHGSDAGAAIAQLAQLGDERAVVVLEDVVSRGQSTELQVAAVRALGRYPSAVPYLFATLREPRASDVVRATSGEVLASLGAPGTAEALIEVREGADSGLRARLDAIIAASFPQHAAALSPSRSAATTGWLMLGGGAGLGYTLAAAGHFGQSDLAGLGATAGAAGGATAGYFLARARPIDPGDAAFITSNTIVGTALGTTAAIAAEAGGDAVWGAGLAGEAIGLGLGLGLRQRHQGRASDGGEAIVGAVAGYTAGSFYASALGADDRGRGAVGTLTGLGTYTIAQTVGTSFTLHGTDESLLPLGLVLGTELGLAIPDDSGSGIPVATALTGLGAAWGTAAYVDLPGDVTTGAWTGVAYGSAIGLGLGLGSATRDEGLGATTLVGGALGTVAGGYLAHGDPAPVSADDVALSALGAGWGLYQAIGWIAVSDASDPRLAGLVPLVPGLVGGGLAVASPTIQVDWGSSLAATSVGLWGSYVGGVVTTLAVPENASGHPILSGVLLGGDLGLVGGAVLMHPALGVEPAVVGFADAGGLLGGATATLVVALASGDRDSLLAASLVGSGAGMAGGAALGNALLKRPARASSARVGPAGALPDLPGQWSVVPMVTAVEDDALYGGMVQVVGW